MPPENDTAVAERIVRLETKFDFLIEQMHRLPPSPTCIINHRAHDERMTKIEEAHDARISSLETWRNRAIGALLILNLVLVFAMEKVRSLFFP